MTYAEWCEVILRAVINRADDAYMFGMPHLGVALGVKEKTTWGDAAERDIDSAIIAACDDLEQIGLIETSQNWASVKPTLSSRPFRKESLTSLWPRLADGALDPDEEAFLREVAALSEREHDTYAEATWVMTSQAFERLAWDWDRGRSLNLLNVLERHLFIAKRVTVGDVHNVRVRARVLPPPVPLEGLPHPLRFARSLHERQAACHPEDGSPSTTCAATRSDAATMTAPHP